MTQHLTIDISESELELTLKGVMEEVDKIACLIPPININYTTVYTNLIALCDSVIAKNPHYVSAYVNKCGMLARLGRYEESMECLNKAIELNPTDSDLHVFRGNGFRSLKKYSLARQDYQTALKLIEKIPAEKQHQQSITVINAIKELIARLPEE